MGEVENLYLINRCMKAASIQPAGKILVSNKLDSFREHRTFLVAMLGLIAVCFLAGLAVGYQWGKPDYPGRLALSGNAATAFKADSLASAAGVRDDIVNYANSLLGTPYRPRGQGDDGFDCSGFVAHVFSHFDVNLPPSTAHMIKQGREITEKAAQPGDLVFFTGTMEGSTEVGHVGIVVQNKGDDLKFIHSSSAPKTPYVKYDSLGKASYRRRFMMVKRVLEE